MSSLSQTVRKFEHDRKFQPWWCFHQREGKHLVGVTLLPMDTNSWNGKSRLDSSSGQNAATLSSNNNHWLLSDPQMTWTTMCPPKDQMTCPTPLATTCQGIRGEIWDYSSPGHGWPDLVVHSMLTIQVMTFLSVWEPRPNIPLLSVLPEWNTIVD